MTKEKEARIIALVKKLPVNVGIQTRFLVELEKILLEVKDV